MIPLYSKPANGLKPGRIQHGYSRAKKVHSRGKETLYQITERCSSKSSLSIQNERRFIHQIFLKIIQDQPDSSFVSSHSS